MYIVHWAILGYYHLCILYIGQYQDTIIYVYFVHWAILGYYHLCIISCVCIYINDDNNSRMNFPSIGCSLRLEVRHHKIGLFRFDCTFCSQTQGQSWSVLSYKMTLRHSQPLLMPVQALWLLAPKNILLFDFPIIFY